MKLFHFQVVMDNTRIFLGYGNNIYINEALEEEHSMIQDTSDDDQDESTMTASENNNNEENKEDNCYAIFVQSNLKQRSI